MESNQYLSKFDNTLTIEQGIRLINEAQDRENKAWQWMLRNRWNVGVIGLHLDIVYGQGTLDTYADQLEMPVTTVRECLQIVRWFRLAHYRFNKNKLGPSYDSPESYFEEFISTRDEQGKPKRWYHLQALIRSNEEPGALTGEQLARRLIGIIEDNNRKLEAVNNVAATLPEKKRREVQAEVKGVEAAYTEEARRFVESGHKVLDEDLPEVQYSNVNGAYWLHRVDQSPTQGVRLKAASTPVDALIHGMKELGYHVSKVPTQ